MPNFNWNDEAVTTLRRVAAEGGSFSDAAAALGLTRYQVAGKAWREGIKFNCRAELRAERNAHRMQVVWDRMTPAEREERLARSLYRTPAYQAHLARRALTEGVR